MIDPREALDRTILLTQDIYPGLSAAQIVAGLTTTSVRLRSDPDSCSTAAGQTAVITTAILAGQLGVRVSLDLPDVPVLAHQPPLPAGGRLPAQLAEHLGQLITAPGPANGPVDIELLFGSATSRDIAALSMRLTGSDWQYQCRPDDGRGAATWRGEAPFGGVFAASAAAAEVYRTGLRKLSNQHSLTYDGEHDLRPRGSSVHLTPLPVTGDIGAVDVISAGAISQGALFALGRLPRLRGALRVIEHDSFALSNLNRYPLSTARDIGLAKSEIARRTHTEHATVRGVPNRFDDSTATALAPLADRVLVGVDRISARWDVQRHAPGWVWVGGTSHFGGYVWTHPPHEPCAGCANPTDTDPENEDPIPTISFVSTLTGAMLAYDFLAATTDHQSPQERALTLSPFNLSAQHPLVRSGIAADPRCHLGCPASRAAKRP
jgi:molybdopterin/thiamine biosynthesis adenylyltransferase